MSNRCLLVAAALWFASAASAQTTDALPIVEDRGNNVFSIVPGPVSLEVVVGSDCSVPVTVTAEFRAAFSNGTDRIGRTAPPKATVTATYPTFTLRPKATEAYSANLSAVANGGVTIVQESPGVCRQVTVTCAIEPSIVNWLISAGEASPLASAGGRLQQHAHVTESKSSTPIDCPPPPATRPAGRPGAAPAPKPLDIDNVANFETFPALPGEPAPADDAIDLGDLLIGAENETVPAIPRGPFRKLSCIDDLDCLPADDTGYFLGQLPPPRRGLGDPAFQHIGAETPRIRIDPIPRAGRGREPMNPLGLLSKTFEAFLEWWMPALAAAEQNPQHGLQLIIGSQGGSTGRNLTMQILNFTGRPVNLEGMIALEPLKKEAQQRATQAFAKLAGRQLPARIDLNGYCLDFLKLPPIAGQVLRFAGPEAQTRFAPMKKVMAAANNLMQKAQLNPDTNPASYSDSIKQWAIWTVEQKFTDKKFAAAFLGHTKKNVEASGQKWTRQIEDVVRQRTPSRWQDIVQILKSAGAAVPQ